MATQEVTETYRDPVSGQMLARNNWLAHGERIGATGFSGTLVLPTRDGSFVVFNANVPDGWLQIIYGEHQKATQVAQVSGAFDDDRYVMLYPGWMIPKGPEVGGIGDILGTLGGLLGTAIAPGLGTALGGAAGSALGSLFGGGSSTPAATPPATPPAAAGAAGPLGALASVLPALLGGLLGSQQQPGAQSASAQSDAAALLGSGDALTSALRTLMGPSAGQLFGSQTPDVLNLVSRTTGMVADRAASLLGDPRATAALQQARSEVARDLASAYDATNAMLSLRSR